jgi:hypothetical protein
LGGNPVSGQKLGCLGARDAFCGGGPSSDSQRARMHFPGCISRSRALRFSIGLELSGPSLLPAPFQALFRDLACVLFLTPETDRRTNSKN